MPLLRRALLVPWCSRSTKSSLPPCCQGVQPSWYASIADQPSHLHRCAVRVCIKSLQPGLTVSQKEKTNPVLAKSSVWLLVTWHNMLVCQTQCHRVGIIPYCP
eukprot:scpid54104/ scgid8632/ 